MPWWAVAALVASATGPLAGCGGGPASTASAGGGNVVYIAAQRAGEVDRVTLPDLKAEAAWHVGGDPHVIVFDKVHRLLWVSAPKTGTLRALDPATGAVRRTLKLDQPDGLVLMPDDRTLLVTEGILANKPGYLAFVDTGKGTVEAQVPVGHAPHSIVLSPDAAFAYVAVQYSGRVAVVDTAAHRVARTIVAPGVPYQLLLRGRRLYVSRLFAGHVTAYDTTTGKPVADYPLVQGLSQLALSPDGKRLYVAEKGLAFLSGYPTGNVGHAVAVIDLGTAATFTVNVPAGPDALAFEDGQLLATGLGDGTVSRIELPSLKVTTTTIGNFPTGMTTTTG
jgi:DNA-binding beta-propeller fold protein YncE